MIIRIKDILHTANGRGDYRTSKIGEKYENRKGKLYNFDLSDVDWAKTAGLQMDVLDDDFEPTGKYLFTTPFIGYSITKAKTNEVEAEIETWNSFYICDVVRM